MAEPSFDQDRRAVSRAIRRRAGGLLTTALLVTWLPGLAEPGVTGPEGPPAAEPENSAPTEATENRPSPDLSTRDPATRWLDEVRAQRQAWEERRKASREAFEARRRATDPWGSAHQEAWEDARERRRETRRKQREQEWEHFRGLGPYQVQPPWPEGIEPPRAYPVPAAPGNPPGNPAPTEGTAPMLTEPQIPAQVPGIVYPPNTPPRGPYSPQDWDNLWYFRGY